MTNRTALVAYGSETGAAQDVAEELGRLLRRLRFTVRVTELNSIVINELLNYQIVLFSISTTGQGDLPGNARTFWRRIRSVRLQPGCLADVKFTSFGLGDTSYPKYNYAHRKLYNRLRQLGAEEFCLRGESDEQHPDGMEGSWIPWASGLKQTLLELYPLPPDLEPLPDGEFLTPEWQLELGEGSAELDMPQPTCTKSSHADQSTTPSIATADHTLLGASGPVDSTSARSSANDSITPPGQFLATVMQNERVTPRNHWQDVRLFEFTTPPIDYLPGDVLTIYPHNHSSSVDQLIQLMNWQSIADKSLRFTPSTSSTSPASPPPLPSSSSAKDRLTLRSLLSQHLDLNAIPRRSFFASLAHFTTDQFQHDRLIEFTAPEYVDEFFDYATRPRRSIIEVLHEFDTVKLPWNWIADILPAIRGRQFSIASGGALKKTEDGQGNIELLIAMVKYRTVIKKIREGLCSRYMSLLKPGDELTVLLCKGGMKINMDRPAILIGPGTGIAPLRSMLLERAQFQTEHPGMQKQKQILFFGNRNIEADYFFEEDWRSLREELDLDVFTAFSRDQTSKLYVQDVIKQQSAAVYKVLETGNIYICGSSGKMPIAVRDALVAVMEKEGSLSREDAEARLAKMEKDGRYQQETW